MMKISLIAKTKQGSILRFPSIADAAKTVNPMYPFTAHRQIRVALKSGEEVYGLMWSVDGGEQKGND